MKKTIAAPKGRIFLTRHAQTAGSKDMHGSVGSFDDRFPDTSTVVSLLGRRQAAALGQRLVEMGFHGKILSSPYIRTMITSSIIAAITGCPIYPCVEMREISHGMDCDSTPYQTLEEMRRYFPLVAEDAEFSTPWVGEAEKDIDAVYERIVREMPPVLQRHADEDILLVGHGASIHGMLRYLDLPNNPRFEAYNCSLTLFDPNGIEEPIKCSTTHLPYEEWTSNRVTAEIWNADRFSKEWQADIPHDPIIDGYTGKRILHISDTYSWHYPYYRKLIAQIRPDVILHTGNLAAEVENEPMTVSEYRAKIGRFASVLRDSGAERILITPGECDRPDEIRHVMPFAEIAECGTETVLDGHLCRISHRDGTPDGDPEYALCSHASQSGKGTEGPRGFYTERGYSYVYTFGEETVCRGFLRPAFAERNESDDVIPAGSWTVMPF